MWIKGRIPELDFMADSLNVLRSIQLEAKSYEIKAQVDASDSSITLTGREQQLREFLSESSTAKIITWELFQRRYSCLGVLRALQLRTVFLELPQVMRQSIDEVHRLCGKHKVSSFDTEDDLRIELTGPTEFLLYLLNLPDFDTPCIARREYSRALYPGFVVVEAIVRGSKPAWLTYSPIQPYELLSCDCEGVGSCEFCCD